MKRTACVILAAGLGTRMKSALPKVLHPVCGMPMLQHVLAAASLLRPEKTVVVIGRNMEQIRATVSGKPITVAVQKEAKGTADALRSGAAALGRFRGTVVVLAGDAPLVTAATLRKFLQKHRKSGNHLSVLSFRAADPRGYGRIVRNTAGSLASIIEEKDADALQRRIVEVNSGVYAIEHTVLPLLGKIRKNPLKGEYYLTDLIDVALRKGCSVDAFHIGEEAEFMGVNTAGELQRASLAMQRRIIAMLTDRGVHFISPDSVFVHPTSKIGSGTTLYPHVYIDAGTSVGSNAVIYPHVRIARSRIGDRATVKDATVIEDSVVRTGAVVGPFAHLRPGSVVGEAAKVGNFVELKKAVIGKGSKASHLSYLGDAVIGRGVNIGAGTITCNYDGFRKSGTVIEDGVFIGSDTQLVAPVRVGRGAYVGAGSTITKDVPGGALATSRSPQRVLTGWAAKRRARQGKK